MCESILREKKLAIFTLHLFPKDFQTGKMPVSKCGFMQVRSVISKDYACQNVGEIIISTTLKREKLERQHCYFKILSQ